MAVHPEGRCRGFVGDAVNWVGEWVKSFLGEVHVPCRQARGPSCLLESPGEVIPGLIAAAGRERKTEREKERMR